MVRVAAGSSEGSWLLQEFLDGVLSKKADQCADLFREDGLLLVKEHVGAEAQYEKYDINRFLLRAPSYADAEVVRLVQSTNEYYGKVRFLGPSDRKEADFWVHFIVGDGRFSSFTMINAQR